MSRTSLPASERSHTEPADRRSTGAETALLWGRRAPARSEPVRVDDPARRMIGQVLDGRFEIVEVLGSGGMGVVFEATDRVLDRPVVVKVVSPLAARDRASGERLLREARLTARVQHPAVVTVFHVGLLDGGEPYLVMERLEGIDLADLMAERRTFPLDEALALVEPVCDALAALHAAGIVHRDIKPENLFVLRGSGVRTAVKLIDFGLAILDDQSMARLTRAGHLLGTAEYLAPECVGGRPPTAASDVYSLACVIFELLTGVPPFTGVALDVLVAKTQGDPPRLRERMSKPIEPTLERVETVLARAMARDPMVRPGPSELIASLLDARVPTREREHDTITQPQPALPPPSARHELPPPSAASPVDDRARGDDRARLALTVASIALATAVVSLLVALAALTS